jgi:alkanesulfonate monooxygenase SsuD/methylene tetrahydromethanopterin reductase-like flavin-dependent oxidoreductase (luciferase family)
MKCGYGTYLKDTASGPGDIRDEVILAEEVGFDGVYFPEHHGAEGRVPSPLALSAHALGWTTELRAGPLPLLLPLHDPLRIAEEASQINFVSGGRLVVSIGSGYHHQDFDQVGIDLRTRGTRMGEGLQVLASAWSDEPWPVDGEYHRLLRIEPLRFRHPAGPPEIWIASGAEAGFRRAARHGHGIVLDAQRPPSEVEALVRSYRDLCAEAGNEPGTVAVIRRVAFGGAADTDAYVRQYEATLAHYVAYVGDNPSPWLRDLRARGVTRDTVLERIFAGAPEAVAERLLAWTEQAGIDYLVLKFEWLQIDHDRAMEQLRRSRAFCERVAA